MTESVPVMYLNGPKAGQIISMRDPQLGAKVVVGVMPQWCKHNADKPVEAGFITYNLNQIDGGLSWTLTTESKFDDTAYYCQACTNEAKVKYKVEAIKELLDELEEDDE